MKFALGFSPCPNDTFIFDALVNKKIDTGDFNFEVILDDVQALNKRAIEGRLDITKVSYGVYPLITSTYDLLSAGGALGKGVGPLLISASTVESSAVPGLRVAIPGENTTAHLLFSYAFPSANNKEFMIFSDIEDAVLHHRTDLGVIIHENRFTYMNKGLKKVVDLGAYWEEQTGLPIPLGGIVMKKSIDATIRQKINDLIRDSVAFAYRQYPVLSDYVKKHAQEMDEKVMRQHIDLYVNDYTTDLGEEGKRAIEKLLEVYQSWKTKDKTAQLTS